MSLATALAPIDGCPDDRQRADAELQRRYRDAFVNGLDAVVFTNREGEVLDANPAALDLFGITTHDLDHFTAHELYADPDERDGFVGLIEGSDLGRHLDTKLRRRDGTIFDAELTSQASRGTDGEVIGFWASIRDVTAKREAERRQELLMRELDHRVRNNLSAIMSLARMTAERAESLDGFLEIFVARVQAMRIAHEELGRACWRGGHLGELLKRLTAPHSVTRDQFTLDGPEVVLPSRVICPLSLVLAELLNNAVKHGALGSCDGHLTVRWTHFGSRLTLNWEERGGHAPSSAPKRGLGSELIDGLIGHELGGAIDRGFHAKGFGATISIPLTPDEAAG